MNSFKPQLLTLVSFFLLAAVYTKTAFGQSWQVVPYLPANMQTNFIAIHPEKSGLSFVASRGNLYASTNGGKNWKEVLNLGSKAEIYDLQFDHDRIFLFTSEGLFESRNQGEKWKKIFSGAQQENSVRSLIHDPTNKNVLYLGTENGLFVSLDNGNKWEKISHQFERYLIHKLKADPQNNELFVATDKGLYRMRPSQNRIDRIYAVRTVSSVKELDQDQKSSDDLEENSDATYFEPIKSIIVTPSSSLAIATGNSILVSEDEGNYWERLSESGLPKVSIVDFVYSISQDTFFATADKAVYVYLPKEKCWRELSFGLSAQNIERLIITQNSDSTETLYAMTKNTIYKMIIDPSLVNPEQINTFSKERWNLLMKLFYHEPSIGKVQKQAIRYANVNKIKTQRWQWTSRFKALVPSFSVGKDYSAHETIDIDRGGTNDADKYILGPPYRSHNWNYDLNWNLSDFIWNSAQTSIDSREKLMVELRNDILNEVTRLYYERRRTQIEFVLKPPQDSYDYANALMRLDELTGYIDALTDGYLTKEVNSIYVEHPEFQNIWTLDNITYGETR